MHTILVPVDGSSHALKALHIACDLADKYGGRIALLHVVAANKTAAELLQLPVAGSFPANLRKVLDAASARPAVKLPGAVLEAVGEAVLGHAAGRAGRRGLEVETLPLEAGDPADSILVAQKRTGATTIVMGSRGIGDQGGSSFGSVSNKVFREADCTCLSVK